MKISMKVNMPNIRKVVTDAAKKIERDFNNDLNRLRAGRGQKSDEQFAVEVRALARRRGIKLDEATVAKLSKSGQ